MNNVYNLFHSETMFHFDDDDDDDDDRFVLDQHPYLVG